MDKMMAIRGGTIMRSDELEHSLGHSLRLTRIAARLTQAELADRANVSLGAVKNLERGAGSTTSTLVKVLHALDKTEWLTELAPRPAPFNPLELLEASRGAPRQAAPSRVRHAAVRR
jgi:transcriptional regulator with XRE-family HTH domain